MAVVTVRGAAISVDDLPTGAVATVELTDKVRRRIVAGYYELLSPKTLAEADAQDAAAAKAAKAKSRKPKAPAAPPAEPPADEKDEVPAEEKDEAPADEGGGSAD